MFFLDVTISLTDLLQGLLYIAGIAALVGLTVMLVNLAKSLKSINKMVDDITPSVTETAEQLPATVLKVQGILDDTKKVTESAGENIPGLVKSASDAGQTLTNTVGILGSGAESLSASIVSLFSGSDKKDSDSVFGIKSDGNDTLSLLTKIAGAAIGTYHFVQKMKKAKKRRDRKKKFGF